MLIPDAVVCAVFLYCAAVAANLTKIEIHAITIMSNHYHIVLTDVSGKLPRFMGWLNRHVALCLKAYRGQEGVFWEPSEKYSAVALLTPEAIEHALVYVWSNPVAATVVPRAEQWPGCVVGPEHLECAPMQTRRPTYYFSKRKKTAPYLRVTIPERILNGSVHDTCIRLKGLLCEREAQLQTDSASTGRKFIGRRRALAADPLGRIGRKPSQRCGHPQVASKSRTVTRKALEVIREFRAAYREAVYEFRKGKFDVVFPAGTWWMVQNAGVKTAPCFLFHDLV